MRASPGGIRPSATTATAIRNAIANAAIVEIVNAGGARWSSISGRIAATIHAATNSGVIAGTRQLAPSPGKDNRPYPANIANDRATAMRAVRRSIDERGKTMQSAYP